MCLLNNLLHGQELHFESEMNGVVENESLPKSKRERKAEADPTEVIRLMTVHLHGSHILNRRMEGRIKDQERKNIRG